jgi:hypothetical protein
VSKLSSLERFANIKVGIMALGEFCFNVIPMWDPASVAMDAMDLA